VTLAHLATLFAGAGCTRLYAKPLAENDNSKNQIYFGPDFEAINLFPNSGIRPETGLKNPTFKASVPFGWLLPNGSVVDAPGAQLILYSQYPEVRFSGFLRGCSNPPKKLLAARLKGRILFLGVTPTGKVIGYVAPAESATAREFRATSHSPTAGVFYELSLPSIASAAASRGILLHELGRIHRLGWIASKQLGSDGRLKPCNAPQCGGFTLEAELGIVKNSSAEPDFHGWEVKQYRVSNFERIESAKAITLMTPEPDGGFYKDRGIPSFVRKFGYQDRHNIPDRLNFGGRHMVGASCQRTGLELELRGFDRGRGRIVDPEGCLALVAPTGEIAASWSFSKILEHWSRKHAKAVYVPSNSREEPTRQYCYGGKVRLAEGTDALRLLKAMATGTVYYDPGIKLERASTDAPSHKPRSQFRVAAKQLAALYHNMEIVTV
jgi:hypothetical protein